MLLRTPALAGVEPFDAGEVVSYMRGELGLDGKGQLAAALVGCPPMLMYNAQTNLDKKARGRSVSINFVVCVRRSVGV